MYQNTRNIEISLFLQMKEKTDEEILSLIRNPKTKEQGFRLLMEQHKERIYWSIRRMVVKHEDAEDILQETFINVYRHIEGFMGASKIYTWIYRIAINECLRSFQKKKLKMTESLNEALVRDLGNETHDNADEMIINLQKAILRLPEKQQLVFNLRYYDDLSYEDISQILNSSVATLKTNYHYAKEKIKNELLNVS